MISEKQLPELRAYRRLERALHVESAPGGNSSKPLKSNSQHWVELDTIRSHTLLVMSEIEKPHPNNCYRQRGIETHAAPLTLGKPSGKAFSCLTYLVHLLGRTEAAALGIRYFGDHGL